MKHKLLGTFAAAVLFSMLAVSAEAAVLRVVVVQTSDPGAYAQEIEKGRALLERAGSVAKVRVWRGRFAGPEAGKVVVSIEFPDMASFASDDKKMAADADYQAWLKGLDKLRTVVSDSLYEELRP